MGVKNVLGLTIECKCGKVCKDCMEKRYNTKFNPEAFLEEKADVGANAYTFEELANYMGVKPAYGYCLGLLKTWNHRSVLIKDFVELFADGIRFEVVADKEYHFCTDMDGNIFGGNEKYREFELRMKITGNFTVRHRRCLLREEDLTIQTFPLYDFQKKKL